MAALIIGYYDNISQQRKEQCYNLVKDFLTEAINKFNPSSRLDHIGDILLATPFLCSHLKIFRRTKIEKLFVYCLLNEDTNPMMNVDSLSGYGNAGIRNYLAKTNDVQLFKRLRKRYIKHFIHYHVHLKANYAFRRPFPFTYRMASKIYKVCQWLHISSPSCFNPNKYYSQEDITLHNPITQYSKCFWAKHKPLFHIEKDINSHLHCNLVQFLNPAQISVQKENSIINCLKICLEYLFPIREKEKSSTPSYIYWLREKYLRQLSLCVLNMSRDGRQKFIGELSSIDKVNFVAEFVKQLVIAEDMFTHQKAFWEIMINILADAENEIDNHCPQSREYTELLEALTLTSIKWKEDVNSWNSFGKDTIEYFKQLISTFGQHKYLAICICHFINGIGQCYLFEGITWISTILANSSISFEDETSELFNVTFENLIPRINEKKMK